MTASERGNPLNAAQGRYVSALLRLPAEQTPQPTLGVGCALARTAAALLILLPSTAVWAWAYSAAPPRGATLGGGRGRPPSSTPLTRSARSPAGHPPLHPPPLLACNGEGCGCPDDLGSTSPNLRPRHLARPPRRAQSVHRIISSSSGGGWGGGGGGTDLGQLPGGAGRAAVAVAAAPLGAQLTTSTAAEVLSTRAWAHDPPQPVKAPPVWTRRQYTPPDRPPRAAALPPPYIPRGAASCRGAIDFFIGGGNRGVRERGGGEVVGVASRVPPVPRHPHEPQEYGGQRAVASHATAVSPAVAGGGGGGGRDRQPLPPPPAPASCVAGAWRGRHAAPRGWPREWPRTRPCAGGGAPRCPCRWLLWAPAGGRGRA